MGDLGRCVWREVGAFVSSGGTCWKGGEAEFEFLWFQHLVQILIIPSQTNNLHTMQGKIIIILFNIESPVVMLTLPIIIIFCLSVIRKSC